MGYTDLPQHGCNISAAFKVPADSIAVTGMSNDIYMPPLKLENGTSTSNTIQVGGVSLVRQLLYIWSQIRCELGLSRTVRVMFSGLSRSFTWYRIKLRNVSCQPYTFKKIVHNSDKLKNPAVQRVESAISVFYFTWRGEAQQRFRSRRERLYIVDTCTNGYTSHKGAKKKNIYLKNFSPHKDQFYTNENRRMERENELDYQAEKYHSPSACLLVSVHHSHIFRE